MMKKFFTILTVAATLFSCGEKDLDVDDDYFTNPEHFPYGNNTLVCQNIISIKNLKEKYADVISSSKAEEITEDIQLRGIITGNDIESNLSNQVSLQDETGGIMLSIQETGLCTYLPVGEEILVNLKGLYIGGYGKMPQIGSPYNNSIGRMSKLLWREHFRILFAADTSKVKAKIVNSASELSEADLGTLVTLKNVSFKDADGRAVFAPTDSYENRYLNEQEYSSNYVVRTSGLYAKFAKEVMPQSKVDLTAVFTRFNNTWQLLIRQYSDVKILNENSSTK